MESSSSPVRLYVGCLPASVTRATIEKHFGTFGNISEIIVKGPSSGDNRVYSLKYAFFTAANESVARAILDASPHTIDGSGLKPERAHKPRVREGVADRMLAERSLTQGCKLFVGGLTNNTTKEDLHVRPHELQTNTCPIIQPHPIPASESSPPTRAASFFPRHVPPP